MLYLLVGVLQNVEGTSVLLPVYVDCSPNQAPPMAIRAWQHMVCAYIYFLFSLFSFLLRCRAHLFLDVVGHLYTDVQSHQYIKSINQ